MAVINTNVQSLTAQRNLSTSQSQLSTSMQRLSSGLRINSAKDDAAGLAISERMSTQIRGLNQAARNANDGVSLAQTAEGALGTIGNNLQRIRELAVQSRNATNSTEDRAALQKEVAQLTQEVGRVAKDTAFNGTNLLDGSFTAKAFQVGANQGQLINIDSIVDANVSQLGSWTSVDVPATVNGATIKGGTAVATASAVSGAFTPDGTVGNAKLVVGGVEIINKTTLAINEIKAADVDAAVAAKKDALKAAGITYTGTAAGADLKFAKADGTDFDIETTASLGSFAGADFADGTNTVTGGTTAFTAVAATELTINGKDIVLDAATNVADRGAALVDKINAEFADGSVKASFTNGKLNLTGTVDIEVLGAAAAGAGLAEGITKFTAGKSETGFSAVDVSTAEGADNAILAMDAALKAVNSARADLGAIQNRFESVVSNLNVNSENLSASRSRILDADFASETANLSRSQILQHAGTAMVAQANQLPQGVLALLR